MITVNELLMRINYLEDELYQLENTTWEDDMAQEEGNIRINQINNEITDAYSEMDSICGDPYNMREVYGIYNKI